MSRVAPTMLGMVALAVTAVTASTVWLFLMSPVTVATVGNTGSVTPLAHEIVDALMRSLDAVLHYL